MALKQLLVHLNGLPTDDGQIVAALMLAAAHGARVSGIFVDHRPSWADAPPDLFLPEEVVAAYDRRVREIADEAEQKFRRRIAAAGVAGDWYFRVGPTGHELDRQARFADWLIVGQRDRRYDPDDGAGFDPYVDRHLVLRVARPLLFIPSSGAPETIGSRVVVAWNGSREAARAVQGALPLLRRARRVSALSLDAPAGPPGSELCAWLGRHGVTAVAVAATGDGRPTGQVLLETAADRNADLIVMGAYGHSRAYETVLGGVTHDVLLQMTLPILMAH